MTGRYSGRVLRLALIALSCAAGCHALPTTRTAPDDAPYVVVLGVAQDAGYPQTACRRACCAAAWRDPARRRLVSCLGIVDPVSRERWLVDATPDLREQLHRLDALTPEGHTDGAPDLDGILLTHAHIGHYTGLQDLGREVTGNAQTTVHAMPRLATFLRANGPWSLLVDGGYVELAPLADGRPVALNERITVTPLLVPHRDEFSETVGFRIDGPGASVLFIPDIDKWERWSRSIEAEIARVDVAFLDGTFYANGEIPGRDMAEIPHPFIEESMQRFARLPAAERAKIRFIHLNHTNPALDPRSAASREILDRGYGLAVEGTAVELGVARDPALRTSAQQPHRRAEYDGRVDTGHQVVD